MTIHIWHGVSGAGKTEEMFKEIYEETKDHPLGSYIYIITPTQNTLRYESIITGHNDYHKPLGSFRTTVVNFNRLMWHVYNEIGHVQDYTLSEHGHTMLIHKLMTELSDELVFYKRNANEITFTSKILDMLKELSTYHISPSDLDMLEPVSQRMNEKLNDVKQIYEQYLSTIEVCKIEPLNNIPHFVQVLNSNIEIHSLKDAVIYIDGFHNFSESEFLLIEALSKRVKKLNVLLTHDKTNKLLFRKTDAVIERLRELTHDNLVFNNQFHEKFTQVKRTMRKGLIELERHVVNHSKLYHGDGIEILQAPNAYEEINEVARQIEHLIRDEGASFSDIAITYRDSDYLPIVQSTFRRFNISYHLDKKIKMYAHPFIKFIIALIQFYQHRQSTRAFINILKSGYLNPNERESVHFIENAIIEKGIHGNQLNDDVLFTTEYRLVDDEIEKVDRSQDYAHIIEVKNKVYKELQQLFNDLDSCETTHECLKTFYNFIEKKVRPVVEAEIDNLAAKDMIIERDKTEEAYQLFIRLLDDAYVVFDECVDVHKFFNTLLEGLKNAEFSLRPSTVDQVMVGNLDLAKVENKKYVFTIGMNREVMPKESRSTDIINDDEKKVFEAANIIISPNTETLMQDEAFVFYLAMTHATDRLFISFSEVTPSGLMTKISPFVTRMIDSADGKLIVKKVNEYILTQPKHLVTSYSSIKPEVYRNLKGILTNRRLQFEDIDVLVQYPEFRIWLQIMRALAHGELEEEYRKVIDQLTDDFQAHNLLPSTAKELYGDEMHASVSRFESYYRCYFQHFANYGLKLNPRKPYQVEALEIGNLTHDVLYLVTKRLDETFVHDDRTIQDTLSQAIDDVSMSIQFGIFNKNAYHASLKQRMNNALFNLITFMRDIEKNGSYKIHTAELNFGLRKTDDLKALKLQSNDGHDIYIRGKIDRIDYFSFQDQTYINVIDYKTGQREINRHKVLSGIELQMFTYMMTLIENGKSLFNSKHLKPNSMLYYHIKDTVVRNSDAKKALKDHHDNLRPHGNYINEHDPYYMGLSEQSVGIKYLLDAYDTFSDYKNYFRFRVKKDNDFYKGDEKVILNIQLFEYYTNHIKTLYKQATDEIYRGNVKVSPMNMEDKIDSFEHLPCKFCDFKHACHIDLLNHHHSIRPQPYNKDDIDQIESEVTTSE